MSRSLKMNGLLWLLLLGCWLWAVPTTTAQDLGAPQGTLLEAESHRPPSTVQMVEDVKASGGKAVTSAKEWEPMFTLATPTEGEVLELYVRHKGGPLQLKAVVDGQQKELRWIWDQPADWQWSSFGKFPRSQLGSSLLIIRGGKNDVNPQIDCVVISSGESPAALVPNAPQKTMNQPTTSRYASDRISPPLKVNVLVDWSRPKAPITLMHWGVADYDITMPERARNAGFNAYLKQLQPAFIRIHHAGLSDRWTDAATRTWDVAKIKQGFADTAEGYGDARIMMNIASWPSWFHKGATLPPEKEAEFAAFCGEFARIMKEEVGRKIEWWEVLNEREGVYEKENRLGDLWRLQNMIKLAIRGVDPQAKVGGPAMTWPKTSWVESYLKASAPLIDFFTWHNYASGSADDSDAMVLAKPDTLAGHAADVLRMLPQHAAGRDIETYLTEFNISWTWETRDPRMVNHLGAVFDALVIKRLAELGVTGIAKWHVKDGIYGMIGPDNQPRPSGVLYLWSRPMLTGTMVASLSDHPDHLEALAIQRDDGTRSLLLINKSPRRATVNPAHDLLHYEAGGIPIQSWIIDETTTTSGKTVSMDPPTLGSPLTVPGYSVTLLTNVR